MKIILLLIAAITFISCTSKNYQHNGMYQNSLGGIYILKDDTLIIANMIPEVKDSLKMECIQYADKIECKQQNGEIGILKVEEKGISDGMMYFTKIKK